MYDTADSRAGRLTALGYQPVYCVLRSDGNITPLTGTTGGVPWGGAADAEPLADREYKLAFRVPPGVLVPDVDDHDGTGTGPATIKAMEAELGPLPPTWQVTARGPGQPTGRFLYRIPDDLVVNNKPFKAYGGSVDAVRVGWRWSWAPGTMHHNGRPVICYGPDGAPCELPPVSALPALPDAWVAYFAGFPERYAASLPDADPEPLPDPLPPGVAAELARDEAERPANSEGTGPALHTAVMALARACWDAGLSQGQATAVAALSPYPDAMGRQRGTTAAREMTRAWGVCEAEAPGEPDWLAAGRVPSMWDFWGASARNQATAAARGQVPPSLNGRQEPAQGQQAGITYETVTVTGPDGHPLLDSVTGQPVRVTTALIPAAPAQDPDAGLAALAAQYTPVDWEAAWQAQPDEVEWLHDPMLERGTVNAMFALPGTGKSLIAQEICLALARAGHVVVYIDDENRVTDLVERYQAFGASPGELAGRLLTYSFASLPPLDTDEGGWHLRALAVTNGASLVVLDTTSRMVAGRENDSDTFLQLYRCALVPLKRRGITVLRLDHPGKDESRGQRGSSAKDGDVDTIWHLTGIPGGRDFRLERDKSRSGHGAGLALLRREYFPLRHEWSIRGAGPEAVLAAKLDILGVPRDAGRPAARKIMDEAGVKATNAVLEAAIRYRKAGTGSNAASPDELPGVTAENGGPPGSSTAPGTARATAREPVSGEAEAQVSGGPDCPGQPAGSTGSSALAPDCPVPQQSGTGSRAAPGPGSSGDHLTMAGEPATAAAQCPYPRPRPGAEFAMPADQWAFMHKLACKLPGCDGGTDG
jgi:hypothetical protein